MIRLQVRLTAAAALCAVALFAGCAHPPASMDEHAGHDMTASSGTIAPTQQNPGLPAGAADAQARLAGSPRHGEWALIKVGADSVRAWVVYPQVNKKAPIVIVVHEIFGLTSWVRAVADQLAADGFIAIAPDLLTGKLPPNLSDSLLNAQGPAMIRTLDAADVQNKLDAIAQYGMSLPAATKRYGIVGYCWGGGVSFAHAAHAGGSSTFGASVVYYGVAPKPDDIANIHAPVLGLYGDNDMRVNATIPIADSVLKPLGRTYEHAIFPGAGHGFLRAQTQKSGEIMQANLDATKQAWPRTIAWFRKNLGS